MQTTITTFDHTAEGWERALYAFLAEKERRSGSRRTVEGYSRMLQHCFGTLGKPPDQLTSQEVFAQRVPGPLIARGDDRVPAAAGGRGGRRWCRVAAAIRL